MLRRRFLQSAVAVGAGCVIAPAFSLTFKEYRQQQTGSFQDYQARFNAARQAFREQVRKYWQKAELSSETRFVHYSQDLTSRSTIDFEKGIITLEAQADTPADAGHKIRDALERLMTLDTRQAYRQDAVQQLVDKDALDDNAAELPEEALVGTLFSGQDVSEILKPAEKSIGYDRRPVAKVVIKLPKGSTAQKAARYKPLAEKYGAEQKVSPALIMAIMHTESFFNPMARSHIPAFGLMQIVPQSAGLDTTEYLTGRSRLMQAAELYQPETNIRNGAAYLHILNYRYLKSVEDPRSRLYCVIAAYNTGAGNVARSFTGSSRVSDAARRINRLSPDKVYLHLLQNLPYGETRDYLKKVNGRLSLYQA